MSYPTQQQLAHHAHIRRKIVHRTGGRKHGPITRLVSPSDLGEFLKPFVFLDLFEAEASFGESMPVHPHSGIATVTVITEGNLRFNDPDSGRGSIGYGGVEWMRAGNGVWHGKEMSAGTSSMVKGFQLWIALPPELENAAVDSQYLEAGSTPVVGPAHVVLGGYQGVRSPVRAPAGINYLLVTLAPGERWTYQPPARHEVLWLSLAQGQLQTEESIYAGEIVAFEHSDMGITVTSAGNQDAVFVLGSAIVHDHDLALGYYSVHTSQDALQRGEANIAAIRARMPKAVAESRSGQAVPIFK